MEVSVQGLDSFLHQLIRVKIDYIDGFRTDSFPKLLELRHGKLIRIDLQLHILIAGILRLHSAAVIDGIKDFDYRITAVCHFLGNLNRTVCLVSIILIGQCALLINVAVDNEIKVDCLGSLAVHDLLIASCIHDDLALK